MSDYDDDIDTFVNYSLDCTFCRIINNTLYPTRMTIDLGVEIFTQDEEELGFALKKVAHWFRQCATGAIIASGMNVSGLSMLLDEESKPRLTNNLMVTPAEPTDTHLMHIFRAKINALADDAFEVISIEVNTNDSEGLAFTYVGDGEGVLPEMDEWVPGPNWFPMPWWDRCDISMIDTSAPEGTDFGMRPQWAATLEHLRDREEQTAIIIKGDWEPRLVEEPVVTKKKKSPKKK